MGGQANSAQASWSEVVETIADKVSGGWLRPLILSALAAWVAVRLGPFVIEAYVRDRDSRRRHMECMLALQAKLEHRRRKRHQWREDTGRNAGGGEP